MFEVVGLETCESTQYRILSERKLAPSSAIFKVLRMSYYLFYIVLRNGYVLESVQFQLLLVLGTCLDLLVSGRVPVMSDKLQRGDLITAILKAFIVKPKKLVVKNRFGTCYAVKVWTPKAFSKRQRTTAEAALIYWATHNLCA